MLFVCLGCCFGACVVLGLLVFAFVCGGFHVSYCLDICLGCCL